MPYITPENRRAWDIWLRPLVDRVQQAGSLNFLITRLALAFIGDKPNYDRLNAAVGALECAKLELYRRAVAPYEDKKIAENGDVYP